ncbi:MAG TPA: lactate racemase domain-containing protein, partial [Pyrinomonadaceae bacterium]|nr:lactate racemase domain-containing protein [Pyrinomonadaceae bacterium]
MSTKPAIVVTGKGAPEMNLSPGELRAIVEGVLMSVAPGACVLAIIPDKTRDDNTDILFPFAAEILQARGVAQFDALIAQGTHTPMSDEEKRAKIGAGELSS